MRREDWDARYSRVESLWSAKPHRVLVAEASPLSPGRALDLACGEGQNAIWLAAQGWTVIGVDFSEVAIARARGRARRERVEAEFLCRDLLDYVPDEAAHDLVLLFYLQLPAPERRRVLAGAAASLAPGGTLLLVGHDLLNLTEGVGGPTDPSVLYTPDEIALELSGLTIERAERLLRGVEGAPRPAVDALVRARRPPSWSLPDGAFVE